METCNAQHLDPRNVPIFPHLEEEDLYSKSLFKTISVHDLKNVLRKKNIEFSSSDSYHILTLKLRVKLLKDSNADITLVQPLVDEISSFFSTRKVRNVYKCCLTVCPFKTSNHERYVDHLRALHSTSKTNLICQLKGCQREFAGLYLLLIHIKTTHRSRPSLVKSRQSMLVEQFAQLRCMSSSCGNQIVQTIKELKNHQNWHFDRNHTVACIFSGCFFSTSVPVTFRSHCSKKHRMKGFEHLKSEIIHVSSDNDELANDDTGLVTDTGEEVLENFTDDYASDAEDSSEDDDAGSEEEEDSLDIFMKAVAISFNDWMNLKNIPYSTCNLIIQEVFKSYSEGKACALKKIRSLLMDEQMEEERMEEILRKIAEDDPFEIARRELESEGKRLNFIKETFEYVKPETVDLPSTDKNVKESYQYIPIIKSLKVLLEDETYIKQKLADDYFQEDSVYKDVRDGENFKANQFFTRNPEAVPILMFQDELEVANPLGSGKTKHKINWFSQNLHFLFLNFNSFITAIKIQLFES